MCFSFGARKHKNVFFSIWSRGSSSAASPARTEFELSFLCVCVCFFAGLHISLDLVEPILRHRLELGVVALGLSLKLSSKRVAALARIVWKNESKKNETSVEQRTFACNSFHFFSVFFYCISYC